jgi:DNA (cytosine-5)-methyltransferase 1
MNELAIQQSNDGGLRELALFAGAGGGILGGHLLGWRTVCAVERDAYAAQVLAQRQNDGILEPFPIWSDVCTFDGRPWRGIVDVISGGFPCQDISVAGKVRESVASAADCGKNLHGLLARWNQASSMWKIPQCSLFADLEQSLEIWPKWGSMLNGVCYQQPTLVHHTSEKESGYWPTPTATEGTGGGSAKSGLKALHREKRPSGNHRTFSLRDAVKIWPTPTASASASKGSSPATLTRKSGKSRINDRLDHAVMHSDSGQLNPTWVEWLMGWPLGWTDLKPLEMDKFQEWQQQHSLCLQNEQVFDEAVC